MVRPASPVGCAESATSCHCALVELAHTEGLGWPWFSRRGHRCPLRCAETISAEYVPSINQIDEDDRHRVVRGECRCVSTILPDLASLPLHGRFLSIPTYNGDALKCNGSELMQRVRRWTTGLGSMLMRTSVVRRTFITKLRRRRQTSPLRVHKIFSEEYLARARAR